MIQAVDPWEEFGPYALKIADHCKIVPGMQVRGLLPVGAAEVGRVYSYPADDGQVVIIRRPLTTAKLATLTSPAPDLSDPITLAYCWPVLRAHLTADEIIKLRALADLWSMEPPIDSEMAPDGQDNDHD